MHAGKAILMFLGIVLGILAVIFVVLLYVPSWQPDFMVALLHRPASTANDALDKFRSAIEKRNYRAASLYLSAGEYKDWFNQGRSQAVRVATECANLRSALEIKKINSPQSMFMLFVLDPMPGGYKYETAVTGDAGTATISWADTLRPYGNVDVNSLSQWQVPNAIHNSLLARPGYVGPIQVEVKKEADGGWRITFPLYSGPRHLKDTATYLRDKGNHYKDAIESVKDDIKNTADVQSDPAAALRGKLEEAARK